MIAFLAILHSRAQRGRLWLIQDFRNAMTGCALWKKYDEEVCTTSSFIDCPAAEARTRVELATLCCELYISMTLNAVE